MSKNLSALAEGLPAQRPRLVAAVAAIAAVLFAAGYLNRREAQILRIAEPVGVAVAGRDLMPGERIDEAAVRIERIPRRFVEPAALLTVEEAAGRRAAVAVRAGTQLTSSNARPASRMPGVAAAIPSGARAYTLFLDEDLSGIVQPDDVVDVLATFDLGSDASARRTTLTLAEGVVVLAVGSKVADALPEPAGRETGGLFGGRAGTPAGGARPSITVAATPAQAQALAFAQASGKLALALRPMGEEASEERTPPTTIATITGGHDELSPIKKGFREYRGR